jgi:3-methyladenine DNA glycosylase AlkD
MMSAPIDVAADHAGFVAQLEALRERPDRPLALNDSYGSSGLPCYFVGAPELRSIIRTWLRAHRAASAVELAALADSLFNGGSYEERVLGALVLQTSALARGAVDAARVERWLGALNGWALIDALCASAFSADDLLADWPAWSTLIARLSADDNINKRRAALVLLTTPVRTSNDPRFRDLALLVVERMKGERAILITKAVSWLLRSMTARHGADVGAYLAANASTLPAIAVRETRVKLTTGTKSGRPAARRRA